MTGSEPTLREARARLESFVHLQTPTKTLSGEAHGELARLVDTLIEAAALPPAAPETPREPSGPCIECGYHRNIEPENSRARELRLARHNAHAAPETWTCPTCHTPMPADAAGEEKG